MVNNTFDDTSDGWLYASNQLVILRCLRISQHNMTRCVRILFGYLPQRILKMLPNNHVLWRKSFQKIPKQNGMPDALCNVEGFLVVCLAELNKHWFQTNCRWRVWFNTLNGIHGWIMYWTLKKIATIHFTWKISIQSSARSGLRTVRPVLLLWWLEVINGGHILQKISFESKNKVTYTVFNELICPKPVMTYCKFSYNYSLFFNKSCCLSRRMQSEK